MAENKKSFVLYADLIHTVKHLSNEQAGELFKHVLKYVNDENPISDNIIINLSFEPIKQQLKRDLKKYESKKQQWSEAGKRSAEVRNAKKKVTKSTDVKNVKNISTDLTVNDNVSVNDNDTVNDILLEKETKELFNKWVDYRNEIKKPIKETTKKSIAEKIKENGYEISKLVIENSIENGWQGLFWDKILDKNNKNIKNEPTINRQTADTIRKNSQGW